MGFTRYPHPLLKSIQTLVALFTLHRGYGYSIGVTSLFVLPMSQGKLTSHPTVLWRIAAFALATSVAWVPVTSYAVEGYNITEGDEWSGEPGQGSRTGFANLGATSTAGLPPGATPGRVPGSYSVPARPAASAALPPTNDAGLPALTPITLVPPAASAAQRGRNNLGAPSVNLAGTAPAPAAKPSNTSAPAPYLAPVSKLSMPSQPLYPERTGASAPLAQPQPAPVANTAPALATASPEPTYTNSSQGMPVYQSLTGSRPTATASVTLAAALAQTDVPITPSPAEYTAPTNTAQLPPLPPPPQMDGRPMDVAATTTARPTSSPTVASTDYAPSTPSVVATPVAAPMATASLTQAALSQETKSIVKDIRPPVKVTKAEKPKRVDVKRVNPEVSKIIKRAEEVYESAGVSIRVSHAPVDTVSELERAYEALMGGEQEVAIRIYQELLQRYPTNEDALFGLAATYHRTGQLDNARTLYGQLLEHHPDHREGLNNFLILMANEAPREALSELTALERRNPDYSPIPAQMGIIYDRLGEPEMARSKLLRAIELSPENWVYKYNLAIMLDRHGGYKEAAAIYKELITASLQGEKIPVDIPALQARLNYIAMRMAGG